MARGDGDRNQPVFYIKSAYVVGLMAEHVSGRVDVTIRTGSPATGSTSANGRVPGRGKGLPGWDSRLGQDEEMHVRFGTDADPAGDLGGSGRAADDEVRR
jgi:hypothetical protein